MRKLRIVLNSPQTGPDSSCPPSNYKLSKLPSKNFSLRRKSENTPMVNSNTQSSSIAPYYSDPRKKSQLKIDLSKTHLRDITNLSQPAHRENDNSSKTESDALQMSTLPVFKVSQRFERPCCNLPNVKKSLFSKFSENTMMNDAFNNDLLDSSVRARHQKLGISTVLPSDVLEADKENKPNTIRTSVLRRLKSSHLQGNTQTKKIIFKPFHKKPNKKIAYILDHDLGYLKNKLIEMQDSQFQAEYQSIYPKFDEIGVQSIEYYKNFERIYLFLNYSTCLKQKTLNISSRLSNDLGLKMCVIFCYLQSSPYPNFDYEDSSISKQDRTLNEFHLPVQISDDISNGYEILPKESECLKDFIQKKLL